MSVTDNRQEYETQLKKIAENYERDGFAVIEDFLTQSEVQAIRDECLRLIKEDSVKENDKELFAFQVHERWGPYIIESGDKLRFFYEENAYDPVNKKYLVPLEQSVAKLAHGIHVENELFRKFVLSQKVKDLCKYVCKYKEPVVCQSMVIFKNCGVGGEYSPHQDSSFLCTDPIENNLTGLWIALERADVQNGGLEFLPKSHKGPLRRRFFRKEPVEEVKDGSGFEWSGEVQEYDDKEFVAAEVRAGSCVILDGKVVHKSGPNTSAKSRWVLAVHFYDRSRSKWCKDNWSQPKNKEAFLPIFDQ